ncbi:MAG: hypothetical protein IKR23_12535 [Lachnospiraceae bacterium]|nr:hypothetical protein [Lachnospiraceae bacterium]
MKKKGAVYNLINLAVLLASAVLFVYGYVLSGMLPSLMDAEVIPVVILTVVIVHTLKVCRLYLALYGSDMDRSVCMKLYCKVTPVSVVLPWKLGEFFRMYCFGTELGSILKGVVIILLDRFFDTMALVTMILLLWMIGGGVLPALVYGFLIFLALVLLIYFAFPGMYGVWKDYLLSSRATEHKLSLLKLLDAAYRIYSEIRTVLHGRGSLLYILSMLAWGAEIGSLYLMHGPEETPGDIVSRYLSAALGIGTSQELQRFVVITILLLIFAYAVLKVVEAAAGKRSKK